MADTLSINGEMQTIFSFEDFIELIDKYMGFDSMQYIRNYFESYESELKEELDALQEEFKSYEGSLESAHSAMNDAILICREMYKDFYEQNQYSRKQATLRPWRDKVQAIHEILNNEL